jgi:BirA family transcriptional regulator, biotin operon repressor / biotin---[acetyl-CoA-carboxylase] ligase
VSTEHRAPLDAVSLRGRLRDPWRRVDVIDDTGSTNADLLARAAAGEDIAGAVLLAEHQKSGRGRHGRTWSAPPRSQISMSVGVSTRGVPADAWGWLPLLTGVAVLDGLAGVCDVPAGLKWPNDVLVGSGKLAGILAEVAAPSSQIVVGLGLNVSLTAEEAPDPRATSLTLLGAADIDRNLLVTGILDALGARIARWHAAGGADDSLIDDYRKSSLTLGNRVRAQLPGDHEIVGVAVAIDEFGRLVIDDGNTNVTVAAGDITHLRPATSADDS